MCGGLDIMDDWFGVDPPPAPARPKPPPDPAIEAGIRMADEVKRNARRRGRLTTNITGGLGDAEFGTNIALPALSGVTYLGR